MTQYVQEDILVTINPDAMSMVLTRPEVADFLRVCEKTVQNLETSEELKPFGVRNAVRYRLIV